MFAAIKSCGNTEKCKTERETGQDDVLKSCKLDELEFNLLHFLPEILGK